MPEPIPVYRAEERAGPPDDDYEPDIPFLSPLGLLAAFAAIGLCIGAWYIALALAALLIP